MQPATRQACLAEGCGIPDHGDGVTRILDISRSYSALEAADASHQRVMRFMNYRRPGQSSHEYIVEFDLLRRKAGSTLAMGGGIPGQVVSILRMSKKGITPPKRVHGSGELPQMPEVGGRVGQHATIIWIARGI